MSDSILIVHIGDIHIRDAHNPALQRVEQIIAAIRGRRFSIGECFLVIPGDIAFSGHQDEYALAESFFSDFLSQLRQEFPGLVPRIVLIPGNHDCNLLLQTDVREAGLTAQQVGTINLDGSFVKEFLAVQQTFFQFISKFDQHQQTHKDQLHYRKSFLTEQGKTIAFTCINSAWMSKNPEEPGTLLYPNQLHTPIKDLNADAEIVLIHHPPNWFKPETASAFVDALEKRYDLIITGHEHRGATFAKTNRSFNCEYIAGKALYDPRVQDNGFNTIMVNLDDKTWKLTSFTWNGLRYEPTTDEEDSQSFLRNKALADQGFQNNTAFLDVLTDMGTGFTHSKKLLRLSDLFVYPNLLHRLYQRNLDGPTSASPRRVKFNGVAEFLLQQTRLFILGADRSGKSALARTLYRLIQAEKGLIPLLIAGKDLTRSSRAPKVFDAAYRDQYNSVSLEQFKQLPASRVCVIIDDLSQAAMSRQQLASVIAYAEKLAARVYLFANDIFDIDCVLEGRTSPIFYSYRQYVIEEFNRVQRAGLIGKWVHLSHSEWDNDDSFQREVESKEKIINTLLGRQLVPALPVIILALLQTMDSARNANTTNGSYGELYEALITERLFTVSKKSTDLGIRYAILARIAFWMFENEATSVTEAEVQSACTEYYEEIGLILPAAKLISDLLTAGILRGGDGNYRFFYPYYYQFFVARYLRDKVKDETLGPKLKERLEHMADRIYYEDYVNILIFYLYLTKDTAIIEHILANAEKIYSKYTPCAMEQDIESLNHLSLMPPEPLTLPSGDLGANWDKARQKLDEVEEEAPRHATEKLEYDESLNDLIKITIAFKTIHILGQVLRNFPGDINKNLKIRIADQCYMLGLRIMSFTLGQINANSEYLRSHFVFLLQERQIEGSVTLLGRMATKALLDMATIWIFAIVKTISHSVGMEELSETYKEVQAMHHELLSVQVIDASIKLDHFGAFPLTQLELLHRHSRKNYLALSTVRSLLLTHFQLYKTTASIRDRMCKLYEIDVGTSKVAEGGLKKETEGGTFTLLQ